MSIWTSVGEQALRVMVHGTMGPFAVMAAKHLHSTGADIIKVLDKLKVAKSSAKVEFEASK